LAARAQILARAIAFVGRVGGGAEWMFAPPWSVFAEYNFMGFGTQSAAFTSCGGNCVLSAKANIQDALVGVNYKF
jgi:outer membrane immunogenic protein